MALLTRFSRFAGVAAALLAFSASAGATPPAPGQDPAPGSTPVGAPSAPNLPKSYPAAGQLLWTRVAARTAPNPKARPLKIFHQFRWDYRRQVVYAVGETTGTDGRAWFNVSVPMRPNGTMAWIPAAAVSLAPVSTSIVIHRSSREIEVYRSGKLVVHGKVAVGAPGRETPLGHFYVTARFVPDDPFLGVFALETSAYSKLTEWPGGGVVGIHGTDLPQLIGQAVSHGCVRVLNSTARSLQRFVPLGSSITIDDN
jgi:lipoprotein-anchoring transpeptidase ErfK/SrfK